MVQNLDYAQTFLEAAGVEQPEDMQGASLVSLMKGEEPEDWREAVYYHYYEYPSVHQVPRHNGIRTERYKLIQFYEFGEWEFYDLQEDPDELTNLFGNSEYETKIAEMKEELEALRVRYDDQTVGVEKDDVWKTERRANRLVVPADL